MHDTKCFSHSREVIKSLLLPSSWQYKPGARAPHQPSDKAIPQHSLYGLLATTKNGDRFPKNMKGRISLCPQGKGRGRRQWASAWQTGLGQAAWVLAPGRHSKFMSQRRVNASRLKYITLCMIQFLCWGLRGEQSYSNQDQFTLNGMFTRGKGL